MPKPDHNKPNQELFEHYNIVADPGQEALRIDKFLMDRIPNTSRNKIQEAAKNGYILVNGNAAKPNYKVKGGDEVSVQMPYPVREIELIPEDIPINVAYEDDQLLVVNKPSNMVVHPGYGNYTGTLVNALIHHFKNLPERPDYEDRPGIVHRLDKNTTGLILIAKTEYALAELSKQFKDRTTDRKYWALVWGNINEEEGRIEGNIGRSLKNRKVMTVFPDGDYGKKAVTNYKVLKRFGYTTLIECKLETGRTHQIRAHLKHIGHPLFGDFEYGGDVILKGTTFTKYRQFIQNCFKILPRQALHAKSLGFSHPTTNKKLNFECELPEDLKLILEKWENYAQNSMDFQ